MFRKFIKWLKYRLSHERCYDQMEERGVAAFGCCCGLAGGSKATNYLSEMCCDCPHWTLTTEKGEPTMDVREKLAELLNEAGDNVFIVANQPVAP